MKIYTKTGDQGKTSLLTGQRVDKDDLRIEAYGTLDELNSFIALLISRNQVSNVNNFLIKVQNEIFVLSSMLANPGNKSFGIPPFKDEYIRDLEQAMDHMDKSLEPLRNFILPSGQELIATCHICRTITRRAERRVISLGKVADIKPASIQYLNRLSDYFFVLGRFLAKNNDIKESIWDPKKM